MKLMTDKQMEEFLKIRDEKDSNIKAAKYIASLNLFDKEDGQSIGRVGKSGKDAACKTK